MYFVLLLVFLTVGGAPYVDGLDIHTHSAIPKPLKHFNAYKYSGLWYLYASSQPCSWKGANKFTDWTQYNGVHTQKQYDFYDTYRSYGSCMTIKSKVRVLRGGAVTVKDPVGGMFSGIVMFVDIDYHAYVITWGCVDLSADGKHCDDGWVTVKTRQPKPSKKVLAKVDARLQALWDITTRDLTLMKHTEPCFKPPIQEKVPKTPRRPYYHHQRKY